MRDISEFSGYSADENADMTTCLNNAAASGEEVHFGSRVYRIETKTGGYGLDNACVRYKGDAPIKWIGTGQTRFVLGGNLASQTVGMFVFQGPNPTGPLPDKAGRGLDLQTAFHIEGMIFDGREFSDAKKALELQATPPRNPNTPNGSGSGLLDLAFYAGTFIKKNKFIGGIAERYDNRTINPATGQPYQPIPAPPPEIGANSIGAGWIDTLFGTHQCFQETIEDNVFLSAYDCGIYDSGQMNAYGVPYGGATRQQVFLPLATGDNRLRIYWPGRQQQTWVGDKVVFSRDYTIQGMNFIKDTYYEIIVVEADNFVIRSSSGTCVGTPAWGDRANPDGTDGGALTLYCENQQDTTAKHAQFVPVQYGQTIFTVATGSNLVLVNRTNHGLVTGQRIWSDAVRSWAGVAISNKWYFVQKVDNNSFVIQASGSATSSGAQINSQNNFFTEERPDYFGLPSGFMASVKNNFFQYCGNASSFKRSFQGVLYSGNHVLDCGNGLKGASVGGPTWGTRMMASFNRMERVEGQALVLSGEECIATANMIKNVGKRLTNPEKPLSVSSSTVVAAISIVGASAGSVSGNTLRNVDAWGTLDFTGGSYNHGVGLTKDSFEQGTQNVTVEGNYIEGFGRGFLEGGQCNNNRYIVGVEKNCLAASVKWGANSTLNRQALSAY